MFEFGQEKSALELGVDQVWDWARRHPGLALGALLIMAAWFMATPKGHAPAPVDLAADETPLFI
jgi:hypothetical protein